MSFHAAAQVTRLYLAHLRLSKYARSAGLASTVNMLETSVLDRAVTLGAKTFIPDDDTSTFTGDGPLDSATTADLNQDTLADFKDRQTPTAITYLPLGTDGRCWLIEALATQLTIPSARGQTVNWQLAAQTTGDTDWNGVILEDETSVTQDTDGTTVDNGAATSNGAAVHLHVTAFSGLTSDDITIEASTTGAFGGEETTLFTFAQVTGLTSERLTVTGTVPRYLRVVDDVTGTGSITRFVAISRR